MRDEQVRVGYSNAEMQVFGTVAILRELVAYMQHWLDEQEFQRELCRR